MAEIKEMTIPLRAAWNVPRTRRANRAITEIKNHVARHMKKREDEDIWIDEAVNHYIWSRGMQKPPRKSRSSAPEKRDSPLRSNYWRNKMGNIRPSSSK